VLAALRKLLGEEYPATARAYNALAVCLEDQARYAEAEKAYARALALSRKLLGEEHPDTAGACNNLAACQMRQGRSAQAEKGLAHALALRRRLLGEEHHDTIVSYHDLARCQQAQMRYADAEKGYTHALDLCRKLLGEDHRLTAAVYGNLAGCQQAQGRYADAEKGFTHALTLCRKLMGEEHPATAMAYNTLAMCQRAQGHYADAEKGHGRALVLFRMLLGEEHVYTAGAYSEVALCQHAQGRYAEAEKGYARALALFRKLLGEEHPNTVTVYNNLAGSQMDQGRYAEAEKGLVRARALFHKLLGEEHRRTALAYANLAGCQMHQGRYAEAEQGLARARALFRKLLGEEHPQTAKAYNDLAVCQQTQGHYAEAEKGLARALALSRKRLGEWHPQTARAYMNLAGCQQAKWHYADAEKGFTHALTLFHKLMGEEHPETATAYNNLAMCQRDQERYAEAEKGLTRALALCRKLLGEQHPDTARAYSNLALCQYAQGRPAAAERGFARALALDRELLGTEHPKTAAAYSNLAAYQQAQGHYAEAEALYILGVQALERGRLRLASSGLARAAVIGNKSALPNLTAVLARNGKPAEAWERFEQSLARGTWDDLSARLRRTAAEQDRQTALSKELDRLDGLIQATFVGEDGPERQQRRKDLLGERLKRQAELEAFARQMEQKYGPAAGQVFPRADIQKALPADTALVGWIDLPAPPHAVDPDGEHWAVVLRARGEPAWVRLRGSGEDGAWADADTRLPAELRQALQQPSGAWRPLADRLRRQRLGPLAGHLAAQGDLPAVRRLVVLPAPLLAGLPVEVFAERYTVSYAPSGTLFAHLRTQPSAASRGLLAVADPVFEAGEKKVAPPLLPPGGLLMTAVLPGSAAARAKMKAGDVLLRYAGVEIKTAADLQRLIGQHAKDERVPVTFWRDGRTHEGLVPPGRLGVTAAKEPAPQELARRRTIDQDLARSRGGDAGGWEPLPGTRVEAQALRQLCAAAGLPFRLLAGSEASEQELAALGRQGLARYRYLHLATHADIDDRLPLQSAVILARDHLPDPVAQLETGGRLFDGRLTAGEIVRDWHLDAELVTLSACRTALGKYERGEGYVGFSQALLLAGSRSVCLSLWKVDDTATALLMARFYENLLGRREGLKGPMPKAEALAEARAWLPDLPRGEALRRAAQLSQGLERGKGQRLLPPLPSRPGERPAWRAARPFAHPHYWAAFVLIRNPD
jgi:tetratricopeptide (TPR) repeat protein